MCFSATASFTAGTVLSGVGALTLHKSRGKLELPIALVPLLFGIQQLTEGFVWLSLLNDLPQVGVWATYIYSMFSHVLWPIFVPFAILLVEVTQRRRTAITVFLALGVIVGLYLLYFIIRFPVTARIYNQSIFYDSPHFFIGGVLVVYFLATCVSGLFSSHRCINVFGNTNPVLSGHRSFCRSWPVWEGPGCPSWSRSSVRPCPPIMKIIMMGQTRKMRNGR